MDPFKWKLPKSKLRTTLNFITLATLVSAIIYGIIVYQKLPEKIPTHFNMKGEADNWGGKGSIFMVPLTLSSSILIAYLISRFGHYLHSKELTKADKLIFINNSIYKAMLNVIIALTSFYSVWMMYRLALGKYAFEPWGFIFLLGGIIFVVVLLVIKNYQIKKRSKIDT